MGGKQNKMSCVVAEMSHASDVEDARDSVAESIIGHAMPKQSITEIYVANKNMT